MKKRLIALLMVPILCIGLLPSLGMTAEEAPWVGGNDSSCTHPSEFVHPGGYEPTGKGQHALVVSCSKCGASQIQTSESCVDSDGNGECDKCNQTMPDSGGGGGSSADPSTCTHPNLKTSEITPGSTGFPYGGVIEYCDDCGYYKEIPNPPPKTDPPATTAPPTDPPATTTPPTDPPATTTPPTDPPATTPPPTEVAVVKETPEPTPKPTPKPTPAPTPKPTTPPCKHDGGFEYRDEGEQHLVVCKKCGKWLYRRAHQSSGGWVYDDAGHWHVCDDCNAKFDYNAHTPNNVRGVMKCKCGWVAEEVPTTPKSEPELDDEIPEESKLTEPGPEDLGKEAQSAGPEEDTPDKPASDPELDDVIEESKLTESGPGLENEEEQLAEPEEKQEEQKPSEETVVVVKESPAPVASPKPAATRYTAPARPKASPRPNTTPDQACTHKGYICFHFDKDYHWVECSKCGKRFDVYQAHTFWYGNVHTNKLQNMTYEYWVCTVCHFHYYRNVDTGEWLIRDYGYWDRSADPYIPWVSTPLNEFPDDTDFFDYFNDPQWRHDDLAEKFYNNLDKLKAEAQRQAEEKQKEEAERLRLSEQARKEFEQRKQEEERSRLLNERLRQKAQEEGVNLKNLSEYAKWMEKNYESVSGQVDQEIAEKKAAEEKAAAEKAEQAKQPATESGGQPAPAASPGPGPGPAPEPEPGPGSDPGPGGGDPGPGGGDPGPGGGDPGPGGGDPGPGGGDPGPGGGDPGPGGGDPGPGGGDPGPGGGNPGPGGGNPGPGGGNPGPGGGGGSIGVVISTPGPASTPPPPGPETEDRHEHIFGLPIKSGEMTHTRWCIVPGCNVGFSETHRFLNRGEVEPSEEYPNGGTLYQCPLCGYGYVEENKP